MSSTDSLSYMDRARRALIFALDVQDKETALRLVEELKEHVGVFKIGLQLFTKEGPELVRRVIGEGAEVFLDLKLHDIPATVERAAAAAAELGVSMMTVHTGEGVKIVEAALRGAMVATSENLRKPLVLGVTVLTSISESELPGLGFEENIEVLVTRRASLAVDGGCEGLVCSPKEVATLRKMVGRDVKLVVPGVRPHWGAVKGDDQARKSTPREVIMQGGDYVVVGRPIRDHSQPVVGAARIREELAGAFADGEAT